MIGMMNSGAESSVEFYAAARQSSLYEPRKKSNQSRTYTPEGRILINGQPLSPRLDPDDMWKNVIIKAAAQKMIKENLERKESGAIATFKRFSEKLKLKKSKSSAAMMNLDLNLPEVTVTDTTESSSVDQPKTLKSNTEDYVTNIRIEVVEPSHESSIDRPQILFDDISVFDRLYEESSLVDEIQEKQEKDSGKGNSDEESVVHKM
uniref:Uncharacterized protein n=1 Tax=Caenorhabditis japonica TaxID=281687 RepID=A0A8R1EAX8_CAEJA